MCFFVFVVFKGWVRGLSAGFFRAARSLFLNG